MCAYSVVDSDDVELPKFHCHGSGVIFMSDKVRVVIFKFSSTTNPLRYWTGKKSILVSAVMKN